MAMDTRTVSARVRVGPGTCRPGYKPYRAADAIGSVRMESNCGLNLR